MIGDGRSYEMPRRGEGQPVCSLFLPRACVVVVVDGYSAGRQGARWAWTDEMDQC